MGHGPADGNLHLGEGLEGAVPRGVKSWSGERALVTLAKSGWLPALLPPALPPQVLPKITSSPPCSLPQQRPSREGDAARHIPRALARSLGIPALPSDAGGPAVPAAKGVVGRPRGRVHASPVRSKTCAPSLLSTPQLPIIPAPCTCLQGFIWNSAAACRGFTVPGLAPPGPAPGVFGLRLLSLVHSQQFVPGLAAARLRCPLQPAAPPARHGADPAAWHLERSRVLA